MKRRLRGVGERAQNIEHGSHAQRIANRRNVFHGWMKIWRKQKRELSGPQTLARRALIERQPQTDFFEHVGAAGAA